jgi:hypothetical protein
MQLQKNLWVVAMTALAYVGLLSFNQFIFSSLNASASSSLVFLPSGLRLICVLLFVEWGSLGMALGALLVGLGQAYSEDPITVVGAAVLSGMSPLLARALCLRCAAFDENLQGLTASCLLRMTVAFAAVSALLHQLWLAARGQDGDVWGGLALHFTGNLLGTLVVLYSAKLVLDRLPKSSRG